MRPSATRRIGMHRTTIAAIVLCLVGASAVVALAVGPATLMNLANPSRPAGPEAGTGPRPNSFDAPTWHAGDTWTYDVNATAGGIRADGPSATGNATVHGWIRWDLSGPNATFGAMVNFSYTVPVRLFLVSGATEDVSTPAGTFPAIPVSMGRPEILSGRPGIVSAPSDPALGFDHEMPVEPLHSAQTWYSGTVKNVVKFHLFTDGMRLNLVLSSYHIA